MRRKGAPAWTPSSLPRRELGAPMRPGEKRLPAAMRDELHGARRDLFDRTDPWSASNRRRLLRYAAAGAVLVPVLAWLFWRFQASTLALMIPLAAVYGLLVGVFRPSAWQGGLLLWAFGILFLLIDGQSPFASGGGFVWFYHLAFVVFGVAIGVGEDLKRTD